MTTHLHPLDIAILVAYFASVAAVGLWIARRTKSDEDLFLAGRSLGATAIGFSLFASNISSSALVGLAGDAYETGIAVANYEWMAALILIFMAYAYMPYFLRSRISTIPEFLERRFNRGARIYLSLITIVLSIIVDTAGGLYAGALVLRAFFPVLESLAVTCIVLALFAGIYTAAGGLAAVVYTDVIQAVVLIVGATCLAVITAGQFDFNLETIRSALPDGHLSLIRPLDDPTLPWLGTLIGLPVLGFYYWVTNQYIAQRVLGAKGLPDAQRGALFAALLKLTPLFIMVLPGALAFALFPNLPDKDLVFPTLVIELLPIGLTGLVLAGLVAAIMSSVDSTLNSASTLVTLDFVKAYRPGWDSRQLARVGRIATASFMVFAALWAPVIANFGGLFSYLQAAYSYIVPPIAVVFLLGMFWPGFKRRAGVVTLAGGHAVGALFFILGPVLGVISIHFTIVAAILFGACLVVGFAASSLVAPSENEGDWIAARFERSSDPVFRVGSWVVLVACALIVVMFW